MSPSNLESIEGLFTKFKSPFLLLKQCGIEKNEYQLILSILSKLGHEYSFFVSTFHAIRIYISNWKIPCLSIFFSSLTRKQAKLIHMGAITYSEGKDNSLIVQGRNNINSK